MKNILTTLLLLAALPCLAATNEVSLFDGKSLSGWKVCDFAGKSTVAVKEGGVLEIGMGDSLTGLVFTNPVPGRVNYEISLEGRRTMGSDFFCGLTFPITTNCCTLILGGWGGGLTGMSSIDGLDASENSTGSSFEFKENQWYKIKLAVAAEKIEAWVGEQRIFSLVLEGQRLGMRWGDIEQCMPLGFATWQTKGQLRNIKFKHIEPPKAQN